VPYTVSHVAVVLPLVGGRVGRRLVPAALVIGSMTPDLPNFVPPYRGSGLTHAAYGPITVDLVAGLVLLAFWHFVLRRPLVDLAPTWVRSRLPPLVPLRGSRWGWAAVSVVVGAYTHVVLDTFTHPGRWGTERLPALNAQLGSLPAYSWLQFGTSAVGMLIVLVWAGAWLARAEPQPVGGTRTTSGQRALAWVAVITVFVGAVAVIGVHGVISSLPIEVIADQVATGPIAVAGAVAICLCLGWQLDARLDRSAGQSPAESAQRRPR
jgi:hypothetical protein